MPESEKKLIKEKAPLKNIKSFISIPSAIGIIIGGISGFLYYIKIGCVSGTCPITSNPWLTVLWGAAVGYLIGDMFKKKKVPENENNSSH